MSEINFAELDKEVAKVMADEQPPKKKPAPRAQKPASPPRPTAPRGRYMDMVHPSSDMRRADAPLRPEQIVGRIIPEPARPAPVAAPKRPAPAPKPPTQQIIAPRPQAVVETTEVIIDTVERFEFGLIEDVPSTAESRRAEDEFIQQPEPLVNIPKRQTITEDRAPDGNNYSIGGRSPFITDAKIEKRPLGNYVPEGSTRGISSTKNTYSQRTPITEEPTKHIKPTIVQGQNKKSGWGWILITLGVLVVGGGIGLLAYLLYTQ